MIVNFEATRSMDVNPEEPWLSPGEFLVAQPTKVKQQRTMEQRGGVSFDEKVVVRSRKNPPLDPEEITAGWYQLEEMKNIRQQVNETLSLMRNGFCILDETTHCTRGLEYQVDVKANRRARRLVVNSVLTEQDLQRYEGINNIELVAESSREFSDQHREQAYLRGLYDQHERVQSYPKILAQENKLMQLKRRSAIVPLIQGV